MSLEWKKENLAAFKEKMKDGPRVLDILESVRERNREVMAKFKLENLGNGIANQLSEVTHTSWLEGEKRSAAYVEYTKDLHGLLLELIGHGAVILNGKVLTKNEFLISDKKFKIKPADIHWDKIANAGDMQKRLTSLVGGKDTFVINTAAGDWRVLNSIKGWIAGESGKSRQDFLNDLQEDSVEAVLSALSDNKILSQAHQRINEIQ